MTGRRLIALGIPLTAATALSACMQIGQVSQPDSNVSNRQIYQYTAIGASDAVGFGASIPCPTGPVTIGPDTEQMPTPVSCPGGTGYVPVLAGSLRTGANQVTLTDLGISGATLGPAERTLGNTYEPFVFGCTPSGATACVPGDFLSDELPLLAAPINTVTIFAGGNDTNAIFAHVVVACGGCTPGQIGAMITADVTQLGADYATLLGTVHNAFPFARIYVANLPNFGQIPRGVGLGGSAQALLDAISVGIDANVINGAIAAQGIPVIDLECDPQSYNPANFFTDGFHPNDSGYALFASKFATAIKNFGAPPPSGNCGAFSMLQRAFTVKNLRHKHFKMIRY